MTQTLQHWSGWVSHVLGNDVPILPQPEAMEFWLVLAWSVLAVALFAVAVGPKPTHSAAQRVLYGLAALAVVLWFWCAGSYSPVPLLGLVFQSPSVLSVVLCGRLIFVAAWRTAPDMNPVSSAMASRLGWLWALGLSLLGWALMLDTFALLPFQMYAWGFGPAAATLAMTLPILVGVLAHQTDNARLGGAWMVGLAVSVFLVLRLPTGNVWDAILDPLLWIALQFLMVRQFWRIRRANGP